VRACVCVCVCLSVLVCACVLVREFADTWGSGHAVTAAVGGSRHDAYQRQPCHS
jgi:hypothetical protein